MLLLTLPPLVGSNIAGSRRKSLTIPYIQALKML
jgi:hypothetical protein